MEFLQTLIENSQWPVITALILGLMTAISPCPLATNITAIGFIGKDIKNQRQVFYNGLAYTIGRIITYTTIGVIFYLGADQIQFSGIIQQWGEKILGPLLVIIGLFMTGLINIPLPFSTNFTERMTKKRLSSFWGAMLLGVVFALAFCPYSGVLYFGMLIPMTMSSSQGLLLPMFFALATGVPVVLFAWVIAFSLGSINSLYSKIKNFELWFRKIIALLFIGVGVYYSIILFL